MKANTQTNSSKKQAEISQVDYLDRLAKAKRAVGNLNARSLYEYEFEKLKDASHFYSFWGGKANDVFLLNRMEYIAENMNSIPMVAKQKSE